MNDRGIDANRNNQAQIGIAPVVTPNPNDLYIPGGLLVMLGGFAGTVILPRIWKGIGVLWKNQTDFRDREFDRRRETDAREYELLKTLVQNNSETTVRLIASNDAMAQSNQAMAGELRGLKDAIADTNQMMRSEVAELRQRVELIESK